MLVYPSVCQPSGRLEKGLYRRCLFANREPCKPSLGCEQRALLRPQAELNRTLEANHFALAPLRRYLRGLRQAAQADDGGQIHARTDSVPLWVPNGRDSSDDTEQRRLSWGVEGRQLFSRTGEVVLEGGARRGMSVNS